MNVGFDFLLDNGLRMVGVDIPGQGFTLLRNERSIAIFGKDGSDQLKIHWFPKVTEEDKKYIEDNKVEIALKAPNGFMTQDAAEGIEKFSTCQFRSEQEEVRIGSDCCKMTETRGYYCRQRNIWPVTPSICFDCKEYSKK